MVNFCMAFHNHQPVGNFDHVIEHIYQLAYRPFLEALSHHPGIRISMHYSGVLLLWLCKHHPEFIEQLKELIQRGQVEILAGGLYEPILPSLTERDKLDQMRRMINLLEDQFGVHPKGLWLAERVWEPHLTKVIAQVGLRYVLLDDSHLRETGLEDEEMQGYYLCEDEGLTIAVFPGSQQLRYTMPFRPPEETFDYIRWVASLRDEALAQVGDDGEKFGGWPYTHHSVYEEGWLERFFSLLEDHSSWCRTLPYGEYIEQQPPIGNIYLPTASYTEMMEWVLPTKTRINYEEARNRLQHDQAYRFLKGGFWRNFFVKYPESNRMHKKMLYVSQKIRDYEDKTRTRKALAKAKDHLHQSQCNCAYWHGVFGGLYLPHLRNAIYTQLIAAEAEIDRLRHPQGRWLELETQDLLRNGSHTIMVNTDQFNLYFSPETGASLFELDYKPKSINFQDTFTRRWEAYHEKIKELASQPPQDNGGVKTIHHISQTKEEGLERLLDYDPCPRHSLLEHFLSPTTDPAGIFTSPLPEVGDFPGKTYAYQARKRKDKLKLTFNRTGALNLDSGPQKIALQKTVLVEAGSSTIEVRYEIRNLEQEPLEALFGVEFNINPVYQDPSRTYFVAQDRQGGLHEACYWKEIQGVGLIIQGVQLELNISAGRQVDIGCYPIYTVSQAEGGYEKGYQGSCILLFWRLQLDPQTSWRETLKLSLLSK